MPKEEMALQRVEDEEEEKEPPSLAERPYYLIGGTLYPTKSKGPARLFPEQADGDRIVDQLMYVPEDYQGKLNLHLSESCKLIWIMLNWIVISQKPDQSDTLF